MSDLKPLPCPFCGHTGLSFEEGSTFRWGVASCDGCDATCGEIRRNYPDDGKWHAAAIEAWNRRAQPAQAVPLLSDDEIDAIQRQTNASYYAGTLKDRDHSRAIEQAVRSKLGAGVGWQPIETAPKDVMVLLYRPSAAGWGKIAPGKWNDDRHAKKPRPFWEIWLKIGTIFESRDWAPTHWMPLPPPPGIVGKEGA